MKHTNMKRTCTRFSRTFVLFCLGYLIAVTIWNIFSLRHTTNCSEIYTQRTHMLQLEIKKYIKHIKWLEKDLNVDASIMNQQATFAAVTPWRYIPSVPGMPQSVILQYHKSLLTSLSTRFHQTTTDVAARQSYCSISYTDPFDFELTLKKPEKLYNKTVRSMILRRPFLKTAIFLKEYQNITLNKEKNKEVVHFVMALSGRSKNLIRFLNNFAKKFLENKEPVTLTISYFNQGGDTDYIKNIENLKSLLENFESFHPKFNTKLILADPNLPFSRGRGLQMGVESLANDDLAFLCDVDLIFERGILDRIRRNTIVGEQAYYPVFFSQFVPQASTRSSVVNTNLTMNNGFWRSFSYGMVSIYKRDFIRSGGFDLTIKGWGLEDLQLVGEIMKSGLDVLKSSDPGLFHPFHDKVCSPDLSPVQLKSCKGSRAQHIAPLPVLAKKWFTKLMQNNLKSFNFVY